MAGTGSMSVTVVGAHVGASHITGTSRDSRITASQSDGTVWMTATSVVAKGMGSHVTCGTAVHMTSGFHDSTLSQGVSHNLMVTAVLLLSVENMAGTGSSSVTVVGSNLGQSHVPGASVASSIGGSAVELTSWATTTSVLSKGSVGLRLTGRSAAVTSGAQVSSLSVAISHNTGDHSSLTVSNTAGSGTISVTVVGTSVGHFGGRSQRVFFA
eukprot:CAMPEP_0175954806 /NCGR_PEP_ID=MMETSP0108-20121206/32136_1 /TAXON_ID=195067 ORGANISM="Goniomonas pacifica, Strain CCMP1869" /NCGR_SAMPLE_ID=MMETSP0108 /ASSEMBLY_ACC=CAM_ASM_000204 /LENGTH=211 /DNA_ID=CAMNT_0017281569 /DNA_START=54 /DNA_END=685 /DNA_ORIENTATION=+